MAKPFPQLGPYEVIADTNSLFVSEIKKLVSGKFETSLAEARSIATINLHIPSVVLGELAYQRHTSITESLKNASRNLESVHAICGVKGKLPLTPDRAKRKVIQRYDAWRKNLGARILKPKITQRGWDHIVEQAVWRVPPFEVTGDRTHEKGFRDRVILEAVIQFCKATSNDVVFLCADGALSTAAENCKIGRLTILPRMEDFASRIKLKYEKESDEWIDELFVSAAVKFYEDKNPDCLYQKEKIGDRIVARTTDLAPPPGGGLSLTPATWEKLSDERITLGTTRYKKVHDSRWIWTSEVRSVAAFSGKDVLALSHEKLRVATFNVSWSSAKTRLAEVSDARLIDIEFLGREMIDDTQENRTQWGLPQVAPKGLYDLFNLVNPSPQPTTTAS